MRDKLAIEWILDLVALGSLAGVAAVTITVCSGCSPLQYVRAPPVTAPEPLELPPLTTPVLQPDDCGAFTFEGGSWKESSWAQPGVVLDTVEVGDKLPTGDWEMRSTCRHLVIPPGQWVVAREARDRFTPMQAQLELWHGYADRQADRHQEESEALAELLVKARRRQVTAFLVGAGSGAGLVTVLVLGLVLGGL